ncbi:MAG: DUF559 domain-containing protein [Verrucomicrobia bacterium]|nr:DUF559 domain-containing protein [Verrucomicrobiota bacterium]
MNDDSRRLAQQFAKSLQRWGGWNANATSDSAHLSTAASDLVAQTYSPEHPLRTGRYEARKDEWSQFVHLSRVFLNACLVQELDRMTDGPSSLEFILDSLDSPIEALMLLSIIICAREHFLGVSVVWTHPAPKLACEQQADFSTWNTRLTLEIRPQSHVGEHRVDFLLSYYGTDFVRSNVREKCAGDEWQEVRIDKKMIVECDGHDFHEKTKEQARCDKERDRNLQSLGYPVYRYTGSEIYADVFQGAAEVVRVLTGQNFPKYEPK